MVENFWKRWETDAPGGFRTFEDVPVPEDFSEFSLSEIESRFEQEGERAKALQDEYQDKVFEEYEDFLQTYYTLIPDAMKKAYGLRDIDTKRDG